MGDVPLPRRVEETRTVPHAWVAIRAQRSLIIEDIGDGSGGGGGDNDDIAHTCTGRQRDIRTGAKYRYEGVGLPILF